MSGIRIEGNTSGQVVEVSTQNQLKVIPEVDATSNPAFVGAVKTFCENDDGSKTGEVYLKSPEASSDFRMRVGMDTLEMNYQFGPTSQNTNIWKHAFTTMTMTQSSGFLNVNASGTSTVSGNYAFLQTWKSFPIIGTCPISVEFVQQITMLPTANEVYLCGVGIAVAANEPVDGCWFEITSNGIMGCIKYNSGTTSKVTLVTSGNLSSWPLNTNRKFTMVIGEREVEYWIDDVLYGEQSIPDANGQPFISNALPLFITKYNSGLIGSSPNMIVKAASVTVTLMDLGSCKNWAEQMSGCGFNIWSALDGATQGPSAFITNSTNPTTALPVNTALTANLPTGVSGGYGLATLWNLAATDMVMSQFLNPLGSVTSPPRTLYITGVRISAAVFSATWTAPAAGSHLYAWSLMFGNTAVSLATGESASFATATAKAARKVPLGLMSWAATAPAVGIQADNQISILLTTPIVVQPGEYVQMVARCLNGAATATGGMYFVYGIDGYYE